MGPSKTVQNKPIAIGGLRQAGNLSGKVHITSSLATIGLSLLIEARCFVRPFKTRQKRHKSPTKAPLAQRSIVVTVNGLA
jgi:hypothetical protein